MCGLGNRKNAEFTAELIEHGVEPYPGSLRFLVAAIDAGLSVAVVSSSANAVQVLRTAGILERFPVIVDGRGRPAKTVSPASRRPRHLPRRRRAASA